MFRNRDRLSFVVDKVSCDQPSDHSQVVAHERQGGDAAKAHGTPGRGPVRRAGTDSHDEAAAGDLADRASGHGERHRCSVHDGRDADAGSDTLGHGFPARHPPLDTKMKGVLPGALRRPDALVTQFRRFPRQNRLVWPTHSEPRVKAYANFHASTPYEGSLPGSR